MKKPIIELDCFACHDPFEEDINAEIECVVAVNFDGEKKIVCTKCAKELNLKVVDN